MAGLVRRLRVHGRLGETQMGQVTQTDHRIIPSHMTSYSVYKVGVGGAREGCLEGFVFSNCNWTWWGSAFLEVAGHLPDYGKQSFTLLMYMCTWTFFPPIKLPLSQSVSFPALNHPLFPRSLWWWSEQAAVWGLALCEVKLPPHITYIKIFKYVSPG